MSNSVELCYGPHRVAVEGDEPTLDLLCLALMAWADTAPAGPPVPLGTTAGFTVELPYHPDATERPCNILPYPQ